MKNAKPKGFKTFKDGKQVAEEVLPNRFAKATITGGDQYQRMQNNYGKKNDSASQQFMLPFGAGFM